MTYARVRLEQLQHFKWLQLEINLKLIWSWVTSRRETWEHILLPLLHFLHFMAYREQRQHKRPEQGILGWGWTPLCHILLSTPSIWVLFIGGILGTATYCSVCSSLPRFWCLSYGVLLSQAAFNLFSKSSFQVPKLWRLLVRHSRFLGDITDFFPHLMLFGYAEQIGEGWCCSRKEMHFWKFTVFFSISTTLCLYEV